MDIISYVKAQEALDVAQQALGGVQTHFLKGKKILNLGDSIAAGDGNRDENNKTIGYAEIIAEMYSMIVYDKAVGGATIGETVSNNIIDQVNSAINENLEADYILFNGLTNDIGGYNVPLGTISDGYSDELDTSTFCGGFEEICKKLVLNWMGAKIIYVRAHNTRSRDSQKQINYGDKAIQMCKKWSIPYVDIYSEGLNTNIDEMVGVFTNGTDATHPNQLGYETYYVPRIVSKMREIT